jgi:hypothetical protein
MARSGTQAGSGAPRRSPGELAAALRELAAETPVPEVLAEPERKSSSLEPAPEPIDAPPPLLASAAEEVASAANTAPPDSGQSEAPPTVGGDSPVAVEQSSEPADEGGFDDDEPLAPLQDDPEVDEPAALAPEHGDTRREPEPPEPAESDAEAAKPWTDIAWQHPGVDVGARRARRLRLGFSGLVTAVAVTLAIVALEEFTANPGTVKTVEEGSPVATATATTSSVSTTTAHRTPTKKHKTKSRTAAKHHRRAKSKRKPARSARHHKARAHKTASHSKRTGKQSKRG